MEKHYGAFKTQKPPKEPTAKNIEKFIRAYIRVYPFPNTYSSFMEGIQYVFGDALNDDARKL